MPHTNIVMFVTNLLEKLEARKVETISVTDKALNFKLKLTKKRFNKLLKVIEDYINIKSYEEHGEKDYNFYFNDYINKENLLAFFIWLDTFTDFDYATEKEMLTILMFNDYIIAIKLKNLIDYYFKENYQEKVFKEYLFLIENIHDFFPNEQVHKFFIKFLESKGFFIFKIKDPNKIVFNDRKKFYLVIKDLDYGMENN